MAHRGVDDYDRRAWYGLDDGGDGGQRVVRRKKTAVERRDQRHRAEARVLQRMLKGFGDVASHRGGRLSRLGEALRVALQLPDAPCAASAATVTVDTDMDRVPPLPRT